MGSLARTKLVLQLNFQHSLQIKWRWDGFLKYKLKMKSKNKDKKVIKNSLLPKKSPSAKLNLLKQINCSPMSKKLPNTHHTHREESSTTRQYDLLFDSNRTAKRLLSPQTINSFKQSRVIQENIQAPAVKQHTDQREYIATRGPTNGLKYRVLSQNHFKRLSDSRSMRELSANSMSESESATQSKLIRYEKFAFRSQKYIRLKSETCTQATEKHHQESMNKLSKEIEKYQGLYKKSLKALDVMGKVMNQQKQQFDMQRKQYQDQIKNLRKRIEDKKINLGHVYSYKEWECEKLVPEAIIGEENTPDTSTAGDSSVVKQRAQDIMNYYLEHYRTTEDGVVNRQSESLSIISRDS